jgi:hypothetical protein
VPYQFCTSYSNLATLFFFQNWYPNFFRGLVFSFDI